MGYSGTVTETAQGGSSYIFTGAQGQLGAVFTLLDDTVTVNTQPALARPAQSVHRSGSRGVVSVAKAR